MKNYVYFLTLLFFLNFSVKAQNDYVITIQTDSIPVQIKAIRNSVKLICEEDGKERIFKAKNVLRCSWQGSVYEPVRIGGVFKRWMFVYRKISGPLSLYVFTQKRQNLDSKTHNPQTFSIGTQHNDQPGSSSVERLYAKKFSEPRGTVHKLGMGWKKVFKKLCADCEEISQKLFDEKNAFEPERIVNAYNQKCPL